MIGMFREENGNLLSHSKGLDMDQITFLQSLKVGDRLIMFRNEVEKPNYPTYTLKKSMPKNKKERVAGPA